MTPVNIYYVITYTLYKDSVFVFCFRGLYVQIK